jgi:hypothetical protein
MKKCMFKRAQTFLSLLRRKLTQTLNHGGHLGHHAAASAAVRRGVRLWLVLGATLFGVPRQLAAGAAILVVDEATVSSTKRRRIKIEY